MSSRAVHRGVRLITVHPDSPQPRLLQDVVNALQANQLIALPTDSSYALVGSLTSNTADALRRLRNLEERHPLTLLCADLSTVGHMARVDNLQHRLLKRALPGPYTFILDAGADIPRRVTHPRLKTVGVRVSAHPVAQILCQLAAVPLLCTTAIAPGDTDPLSDAEAIEAAFGQALAFIVDSGTVSTRGTTVLDMTTKPYEILRMGAGPIEPLDLDAST